MRRLRILLSALSVLLLVIGELASGQAALTGNASEYAVRVDVPPVRALALVMLMAAIGLALVPDREAKP